MEGKQVGRAAAVLAHPGHEDIVEEILSHLDWKTVLVAAQVCQGLNTVVRTSARLQLCLRAAYYGHPDTYHKFDRGVFEKHAPTGKRLDRMIDVFSRWQRCAPKSVHRVGEPTCSRWKASSGLVVGCGVGTNPKSVEWNKELHYHPSMHEARDEPWPSQWSVWDVHGLRDVEFNAAARVPAYTVIAPAEFQDIDICREDNVVAVSVTSVQSMHGEMWLSIRVHCYLLEPTPAHKWESGATVRAIPYPGARGVKTAIPFSAAGMPFHHGVELPCNVQLGPGGTVIISPMGFMSRNLWDWRTGACIQDIAGTCADPPSCEQRAAPVAGRGTVWLGGIEAGGSVNPATLTMCDNPTNSPTVQRSSKKSGYLPQLSPNMHTTAYDLSVDHASKLVMYTVIASSPSTLATSYIVTDRFDRIGTTSPPGPARDVAFFKGVPVFTAVNGYRAIILEGPLGRVNERNTEPYRLHISDYRSSSGPGTDVVHIPPLGCKTALTARPKDRGRTRKQIQYRRNKHGGRKIPFEWSETWDSAEAQGTPRTNKMTIDNVPAFGCPRSSTEIGLEVSDIEWVRADADHLYICSLL